MTAAGNQEKVTKGRDVLVWAAVGLFIIFSSYALVNCFYGFTGLVVIIGLFCIRAKASVARRHSFGDGTRTGPPTRWFTLLNGLCLPRGLNRVNLCLRGWEFKNH